MEKKNYTQSVFDQAFNRVVLYLYKEGKLSQKTFSDEIGMPPSNLSDILKAQRGVPRAKIEFAKFILTTKYNVSTNFLDTNDGQFLNKPLDLKPEEHPQVIDIKNENEKLKMKNADLETRISDLESLIKTQEQLIKNLQEQRSNPDKK